MSEKEKRVFDLKELRLDTVDGKEKIRGYGAVFDSLSEDLGGFREKISQGAFTETLENGADVRALWNHDPNFVLGRTKSGTLKLEEDERGLTVEISPPNTSFAKDLQEMIKRGDVNQMSFGFKAIDDSWGKDDEGESIRTLNKVELFDISAVTFPAYPETSVSVRAKAKSLHDKKSVQENEENEVLFQADEEMEGRVNEPESKKPVARLRVETLLKVAEME
jgi:hypothetical protein